MDHFPESARLRVEGTVREAISLVEEEKFREALETMTALVAEFPQSGLAHAYLAWAHSTVGQHREAIQHGRVAVGVEPDSERISLIYFRALWSAKEYQQAFEEMRRFSALGRSEEYVQMMAAWKASS
ncbi:MAG TPA: tetratricopeptide repeat protein [Terracidiphilus sp.]